VRRHGKSAIVDLTNWTLLRHLFSALFAATALVSNRDLLRVCQEWGKSPLPDPSDLKVAISRLRTKLAPLGVRIVSTRKVGYSLLDGK
jgi:DNA-binding response OmpR family regulator